MCGDICYMDVLVDALVSFGECFGEFSDDFLRKKIQ